MTVTHNSAPEAALGSKALYDKLAEQHLIGALLASGTASPDVPHAVSTILESAQDFWEPKHSLIYTRILALMEAGEVIEPVTVLASMDAGELARVDGPYLSTCFAMGIPAQATYYASVVRSWAAKREAAAYVAKASQLIQTAAVDDMPTVVQRIQDEAGKLVGGRARTTLVSQAEVNDEVTTWLVEAAEKGDQGPSGALSGWSDFDNLIKGAKAGQLIVVAGRPGMGKSVWARQYVANVAWNQGMPAAFYSLEMSRLEIGLAMVSAGARVPYEMLREARLGEDEWGRIGRFMGDVEGAPLYYDQSPDTTLAKMRQGLRHIRGLHGSVGIAAMDYLQLAPGGSHDRQREVAALSRGLKLMAKEFECPIIAVSQLNRGPENRTDKKPTMSDLRESGSIEQDADIVVLLHREDYYDAESPRAGEVDFIIPKHRGGRTDTLTLASQLHFQRFVSMAIED